MDDLEVYSKGHRYGYSKARSSHLVSKGHRNTQLCYGYEVSMNETYAEYSNPQLQEFFDYGLYRGRALAYMTNLAEDGKCMGKDWMSWQKEIENLDKRMALLKIEKTTDIE
jgi:hypothetical protein